MSGVVARHIVRIVNSWRELGTARQWAEDVAGAAALALLGLALWFL